MNRSSWALPLLAALCLTAGAALAQPVVTYSKTGAKFSDVRDDLKTAIEAKGFEVDALLDGLAREAVGRK